MTTALDAVLFQNTYSKEKIKLKKKQTIKVC